MIARLRRALGRSEPPPPDEQAPSGVSDADREIIERVRPYSITSQERLVACIDAVRYCVARGVPGAFAECGVWRGGSVLAMILTLQELGAEPRDIYLYDTFEGMTEPTEADTSPYEQSALDTWRDAEQSGERAWQGYFDPELFNEEQVRATLLASGYPESRLHFVRGKVEDTLPAAAPEQIALLRLDTDWYESTRHELEHLYPRLERGGVLIIDDFGHWDGARRAVEEYFAEHPPLLLSRIDYTGRIGVKH